MGVSKERCRQNDIQKDGVDCAEKEVLTEIRQECTEEEKRRDGTETEMITAR